MQKLFPLPIHHVRGHLAPWAEELPTFSRGRSQQVILISITTGTEYARLTFPLQEPGQRIWGTTQHLSDPSHLEYPLAPSVWTQKEDQREDLPPANLMHTCHLNLPVHRSSNCWHLWIQDCLPCLCRVLNFRTLEFKQLLNVECIKNQTTNNNSLDTQVMIKIQIKHSFKCYANKRCDNNTVHCSPLLLIDNDAVYHSSNFVGVII